MTHGYEQKTIEEVRDELRKLGVSEEELKLKKTELVEMLLELKPEEPSMFDGVEEEAEGKPNILTIEMAEELGCATPPFGSMEWSDFLIEQLDEKELQNGYPLCDGLKRLVDKYIGYSWKTIKEAWPAEDGEGIATVLVQVTCLVDNVNHPVYGKMDMVQEEEMAECGIYNTDAPFNKFQSAIATTRAEVRCYRKLLRLRKVAAEEMPDMVEFKNEGAVSDQQLQMIDLVAKRNNINVLDCVRLSSKGYKTVQDMTQEDAAQLVGYIGDIGNDRSKMPEGIGNYDPSWR